MEIERSSEFGIFVQTRQEKRMYAIMKEDTKGTNFKFFIMDSAKTNKSSVFPAFTEECFRVFWRV